MNLKKPIKPLPPNKPIKESVVLISRLYLAILIGLIIFFIVLYGVQENFWLTLPGIVIYILILLLPQYYKEEKQKKIIELDFIRRCEQYELDMLHYKSLLETYYLEIYQYESLLKNLKL